VPGRTMSNSDARRHVNETAVSDRLTDRLRRPQKAVSALPAVTTGNGGTTPSPPTGVAPTAPKGCREKSDTVTCADCLALPPWQLCPDCSKAHFEGLLEQAHAASKVV